MNENIQRGQEKRRFWVKWSGVPVNSYSLWLSYPLGSSVAHIIILKRTKLFFVLPFEKLYLHHRYIEVTIGAR
jgi:hypothetical protein